MRLPSEETVQLFSKGLAHCFMVNLFGVEMVIFI